MNERSFRQYLESYGIRELNKMQESAIQAWEKHRHVTLLSPTGSGKTLAFLLPLTQKLTATSQQIQAVIVSPARELCIQIEQAWKTLRTGHKASTFYGGHSFQSEVKTLQNPPALLIGTPGRLLDHLTKGSFSGNSVNTLVLDEFDKCLEMGFEKEVSALIRNLPKVANIFLSSATSLERMPPALVNRNFYTLDFTGKKQQNPRLLQKLVRAEGEDKLAALHLLLTNLKDQPSLVFCNHRDAVVRISEIMKEKGFPHSIYHGKMEQEDRDLALIKFRNGSSRTLIATDLASRGLDIPAIEVVIHYQLPETEEAFIHRNGRTARMHAKGVSYIVLTQRESAPKFAGRNIEEEQLRPSETSVDTPSSLSTIRFNAGKRDKISKTDVAGLLIKKGGLTADQVGLIEIRDDAAFVAVPSANAEKLVKSLSGERIKKRKIRLLAV